MLPYPESPTKYANFLSKSALLGAALFALVEHPLAAQTTSTWTNTIGGSHNWTTGTNWSGGVSPNPVSGDTVDFSTVNIAANATLSLDADRTAQVWKFGDTSGSQTWTVNSGNTMYLAGTTPTIQVTSSTVTLNNVLAGTQGLTKSGAGTLTFGGVNTFSGDVTITGGTVNNIGNSSLGTGSNIIFAGNSAIGALYAGYPVLAKAITINPSVTATFAMGTQYTTFTFTGPLTGSGNLVETTGNNGAVTFSSAANTFTGPVAVGNATNVSYLTMNSLTDSANPIQLYGNAYFQMGGGTAAPMVFNGRQIELMGTTTGSFIKNNNSSASNTIAINTVLKITGVGTKTLTLGGVNTGANAYAGNIPNGTGSVINLTKVEGGMWTLSGNNTYTGVTTISGGTLAITTLRNVNAGGSSLGAPITVANGTISIGSTTTAGTLRYNGTGDTSDRVINLLGTTGGAALNHSGTGLWKFTSNPTPTGAGSKTLTLQGSTTGIGELAGAIADNSMTNLTAVNKSGTGTWVLSGTNTYTGETTISGGALRVTDGVSLPATSLLTLNGGALEPVGNFARAAGSTVGKVRLTGGASGFSARGGDIQVAIGTLASPTALTMGSATFVPNTLVLNSDTADSKLTFLNAVSISGFIFQVKVAAATAEMSGILSGDLSGSMVKSGSGTLILSGTNTFQGNLTVSAGTLSLTKASLSQYSNVTVANGSVLNLNFAGSNSVASLTLGDVPKPPGAYNSTNAAPFITGTGVIYVNGGDADGDGMPDGWELIYGYNPNDSADATADSDADGLTNLEEYLARTLPNNADTDADGLTDGEEIHGKIVEDQVVILGTDPLNPDSDGDGLKDGEEFTAGSNPLLVDTDSDGAPDWYEVKAAYTNPAASNSKPIIPYPLPKPNGFAGVTNKPVKVFILSGQSNMVGMGEVGPLGTSGTLSTIVKQQGKFSNLVDANGNWSVMNNVYYRGVVTAIGNGPMTAGFGANSAKLGPELQFGHVMGYANDGPVLIIKASQGNRGIGWDILPPGSQRFNSGTSTYAGYGDSPQSWLTATGNPALAGWYAGKQYDDFFLAESNMGAKAWTDATAYPASCQVVHNGVCYISKSIHTSSPSSEPGVGAQSATFWDFYDIENVTDILDNFATQYPQWAAQGFEIGGFAWFQGHWDSQNPVYANRYETNMVQLINQARTYYENRYPGKIQHKAPFVLATIGFNGWDMLTDPGYAKYLPVVNAQLAVGDPTKYPDFAGNVKTMESRGYWRSAAESPDNQDYHYNLNAETYVLVGDALGRGMLELMGGVTDTTPPLVASLSPVTATTNIATTTDFVATFNEVIVVGTGNIQLKNLTDSTSTNISVADASQVTSFGSVLTINPTAYLKPNKQYAIRIPAGAIKDYAGNSYAGINDDVTWTFTTGQGDSLTTALIALTDHINGISILNATQIAAYKATIDGLKDRMGDDEVTILSAFDLVRAYDAVYGALWVSSGQMTRTAETGNVQWTIYRVMQDIMDYVYTRGNVVAYPTLFNGFKFNSSSNFPGVCPVPPANGVYNVLVNASFQDTLGRDTQQWTERARRPTGAYLAPGTIATVTVPAALVNAGYKIRVGAHSWDFSNKPYIKRLDRSTILYDIVATDVKIASPLGGGIYIEAPMNANAGVINVTITGAARAPFFQNTSFHQTTLAEWLATERTNPAPWADFQTDKFMAQVPRSFVYAHPDPLTVLNDWDASMDSINDLMGFPRIRGKDTMYLQVDVFNRASVFAPGYPTVNNSYSPTTDYGGYLNNYIVRGPQYSPDYTFHEQGHSYFFPKFGGESESSVNLLYVPVLNQKFGYSMDAAFRRSFGTYNANIPDVGFKDNVAVLWMTSFNFSPREVAMADWEKSYQHQGHAKFVDIAQLYGWGALNNFWSYYNVNDSNNITVPKDNDSLMVKLCETAGADVRPLLHFWGIPPLNAANVASQVSGLGLTPPVEVYDLLIHYKSKLPTNNATYRAFCQLYYGSQPTIGGYGVEREHARQWSTTLQNGTDTQVRFPTEIYDEAAYTAVAARVQELLDLYYPSGRPPSNNAKLADLLPSQGTLNQGFSGVVYNYSTVVPYSATSMTITPVASDPSASITVNGAPVVSGAASGAIDVSPVTSVINIVVVSSDTTTTNTYTLTVTHAAASTNANLANLLTSAGTLSPAFASATIAYTATVPYAVSSLTITPTAAQSGATISVNGSPVISGAPSGPITLNVGSNIITTIVTSESPGTTKTYTLTVQRTANAGLSSLATSAGTLAPAFNTTTFNYTATVPFGTSSLTVTPTAADPAASITVNGSSVVSSNPSGAISLIVGVNVITTVVVSQDSSATNTYVLTLTRVAPGSRWWDGGTENIAGNGNAASAGTAGTWDTSIQNWDQGSNLQRTAWENGNDDSAVFAGTAGTVTIGANVSSSGLRFDTASYVLSGGTLTLSSPATITANANATVSSIITGSTGLTKAGTGALIFTGSSNNTFTGGINLNAGTIQYDSSTSANAWGDSSNVITFTGTAALHNNNLAYTLARGIAINGSLTATLSGAFGESTNVTGAVTGSGTLAVYGGSNGWALTLSNTGNTFSGPISVTNSSGQTFLTVASLGDASATTITLGNTGNGGNFTYAGASAPLALVNRQFVWASTTGSTNAAAKISNNSSTANILTIAKDLSVTAAGDKTFTIGGSNTGNNAFNGVIPNGPSGSVALTKTDGGKWILSNANTYSGPTAISQGVLSINSIANVSGGASALGAPTTVPNGTIAIGSGSTTAAILSYTGTGHTTNRVLNLAATTTGAATIDQSGAGLLKFTSDITNPGTGAKTFTLQGSTDGTGEFSGAIVNGSGTLALTKSGTGTWLLSGTNTYTGITTASAGVLEAAVLTNGGSNSSIGKSTNAAANLVFSAPTATLRYTGSSNVTIDRSFTLSSGTGGGATIESSGTGALSIDNTLALAYGTPAQTRLVVLGGTNTGANTFAKVVGNNTISATSLTKAGPGTWILSGANSYTGPTTVSAGKLFINGNQTSANGAVAVSANATLGGTGTIGGSTTIADGGKLEFNLSTIAASHDKLDLASGKSLAFSGASVLTITSGAGATPGNYTLVTAPGGITGALPSLSLPLNWAATVSKVGNDLVLNVTSAGGPGPVDHFVISSISSPQTVGTPITDIIITAQDATNATATSFTGTVTFGGTAGCIGTTGNFVLGVLNSASTTPTNAGSDLTLTVNDGAGHSGTTTIATVQTPYVDWAGAAAFDADPNNDGVKNGIAWLLGATNPAANATALLPTLDTTTDPDYFIYTYRRSDVANTAPNTTVAVQYGSDLSDWTHAAAGQDIIIIPTDNFYGSNPGIDKVQVKLKRTLAPAGKFFVRLNVAEAVPVSGN